MSRRNKSIDRSRLTLKELNNFIHSKCGLGFVSRCFVRYKGKGNYVNVSKIANIEWELGIEQLILDFGNLYGVWIWNSIGKSRWKFKNWGDFSRSNFLKETTSVIPKKKKSTEIILDFEGNDLKDNVKSTKLFVEKKKYYTDEELIIHASSDSVEVFWTKDERSGSFQCLDKRTRKLHSVNDEPALIFPDKFKAWYKDGKLHRAGDEPALIYDNGKVEYYIDGLLHRYGERPAMIDKNGSIYYYHFGKLHRLDGPAIIYANGDTEYHVHGKFIKKIAKIIT